METMVRGGETVVYYSPTETAAEIRKVLAATNLDTGDTEDGWWS